MFFNCSSLICLCQIELSNALKNIKFYLHSIIQRWLSFEFLYSMSFWELSGPVLVLKPGYVTSRINPFISIFIN